MDQAGKSSIQNRRAIDHAGIVRLERACIELMASRFVESTRFDPLHDGQSEQRARGGPDRARIVHVGRVTRDHDPVGPERVAGTKERPEVANMMKGNQLMSHDVIAALNFVKSGQKKLIYESTLIYGDGGSQGVRFKLGKKEELIIFLPFWADEYPHDVRLAIKVQKGTKQTWTETLGEDPKLKAAVITTVTKLLDRDHPPRLSDKLSFVHLKNLLEAVQPKPVEQDADAE
jgi:hypothetical protein